MTTKEYEVTMSTSGKVTVSLCAEDEAEATSVATEHVGKAITNGLADELPDNTTCSVSVVLDSINEIREE